jgi:hypothetical protein
VNRRAGLAIAASLLLAGLAVLAVDPRRPTGGVAPDKMRGVCWEGARRISKVNLEPLSAVGVDWISQTPFGWSPSTSSPEVRYFPDRGLWGETDEGLVATGAWARELGIRTLLKPHLWVRHGDWPGDVRMTSEGDWARWFASYESFLLHHARLAESNGFEALAIGTELGGTTSRTADWRRLIGLVRGVYHGRLTYCANWNGEPERIAFWDALDFIGVQAYYPLATTDRPSKDEIAAAWRSIAGRLAALARRTGRPIVFTEVGFKSHTGSLRKPWEWELSGEADPRLQADAFAAMFETVWRQPWFGGAFVWKWHPSGRSFDPDERDYSPQGKPALEVIRRYYTHG